MTIAAKLQALREAVREALESGDPVPFDAQEIIAEAKARKASRPFDFSGRDELLRDPDNAEKYLADFRETCAPELVQEALKDVAEACRTDWAKLRAMPESEIERIADADDENPPRDDWNDDKAG